MNITTIFLGADHRGYPLKEELMAWLHEQSMVVVDCGNTSFDPEDDFPDFSIAVAQSVSDHQGSLGIVICGSGVGVTVAANKVGGIRAGAETTVRGVTEARRHNNINVLAIGADQINFEQAKELITAFMTTPFAGDERFVRRLNKISEYEKQRGL